MKDFEGEDLSQHEHSSCADKLNCPVVLFLVSQNGIGTALMCYMRDLHCTQLTASDSSEVLGRT